MARNPREQFERLQAMIQRPGGRGFPGGRPPFGAAGAAALLIGGGMLISDSLFNGEIGLLLVV